MFMKDFFYLLLILSIEGSLSGEHFVNESAKEIEIERFSMTLVS